MLMGVHTPSDDSLELIKDRVVSPAELSGALIDVWNMCQDNSSAIVIKLFLKKRVKPIKHVSWVTELSHDFKVILVTDIRVQRNDLCFGVSELLSIFAN